MLLDGAGESWYITYVSSLFISHPKRRANQGFTRTRFTAPIPTFGSASPAPRGFELCPWSNWHQRCTTLGCFLTSPSRTGYPVRLAACLRPAVVQGSLRLTHLMVAQGPGYDLGQTKPAELLAALHGAPLEVLVHSGLTYVGEDLFAALAEAVPALSTLTLVLRRNPHQDDRKPSGWPGTTYQYAPYLAAFPRLTTFAWNYNLMPLCGTFPSDLRIYED